MIRKIIAEKLTLSGRNSRWLCKELNYSFSSFSQFMGGKRNIPFDKLEKTFEILKIELK